MRDELYINGVKADLLENHINLNYSSNLLTDVGKIVSNNSYTIKLPKTAGNLYFIECAHIPSSDSRFPYLRHAARLIRDGVEMISDAHVVLLAVNEYIEIALTWGNVNNLSPLIDKSLREIAYTTEDYFMWEKGENSRTFPLIEYGFRKDEQTVWYHPAVSVKWIIDKISSSTKGELILPNDRMKELEDLFIPLLDRNDSELLSTRNTCNLVPYGIIQTNFFRLFDFYIFSLDDFYFSMIDKNTLKAKNHKVRITITGFITFEVNVNGNNGDPNSASIPVSIEIRNKKSNGTPVLAKIPGEVTHLEGKRWRYSFSFTDCSFELEPNYEVSIGLVDIYSIGTDCYTISVVMGEAGSLSVKGIYESISLGDRYYVIPNLPDLKQIDFLKAISSMLGLFAVPTNDGRIAFVSFDTLEKNKAKAVDWTKLVMHTSKDTLPYEMEYALDDMARMNRFKYKEEKDGINDESYIYVDNLTLESERVAVELPFAATKMLNSVAQIPVYSYDGDKLKYESVTPRILKYQGNTGVFSELSWSFLLEKYYNSYRELVTHAKVITERIHLNSVQLKYLDLTVPVYLAQYGSYFAIINVKTKDDNICEVKLIKM